MESRNNENVIELTDKQLKKLSRADLLEMLIHETQKNKKLEEQVAVLTARVNEREIVKSEAGSIAEAALRLNGVFEAAQAACAQYTENIARLSRDSEEVTSLRIKAAETECERMITEASEKSNSIISAAKSESYDYWNEIYERLERYRQAHSEVNAILDMGVQKIRIKQMADDFVERAVEGETTHEEETAKDGDC